MPHLKELYQKHKDQGLVLIGVHTTNGGEKMAAYVDEQTIDYPVAIDVDNQTTGAYAVDSYPDYYLIDRAGTLRVADLANKALDDAIAKLLAEPAPAGSEHKTGQKPDAGQLWSAALDRAKQSGRNVLVHVHGPG